MAGLLPIRRNPQSINQSINQSIKYYYIPVYLSDSGNLCIASNHKQRTDFGIFYKSLASGR